MSDFILQELVRALADKRSLDELICAQARAADLRDWAALRRCLADEIDFQLSESMPRTTDPDQFVENAKALVPGFDSMMHTVTNFVHDIKGDTAHSEAYVEAKHFLVNDVCESELRGGGIYIFDSVRTASGWKLKTLRLKHLYRVGNPRLYQLAMEKVRRGKTT
jgi:hypothetical protein